MATQIGPKIGIEGEKEYRQQISQIIAQTKQLDSAMDATAASWTENTSAMTRNRAVAQNLTQQITLYEEKINTMNAGVGEVYINGVNAGVILRTPFECDITELVRDGENTVSVRLMSTIRNTIGPFHNPRGDVGNLFGGAYENPHKSWMDTDMSKPGWEYELEYHNPKWTTDCFAAPFGVGDITVISSRMR